MQISIFSHAMQLRNICSMRHARLHEMMLSCRVIPTQPVVQLKLRLQVRPDATISLNIIALVSSMTYIQGTNRRFWQRHAASHSFHSVSSVCILLSLQTAICVETQLCFMQLMSLIMRHRVWPSVQSSCLQRRCNPHQTRTSSLRCSCAL